MHGEFVGVWSATWREIWSKLARHPKAPDDLFSELYREMVNALTTPQTDAEKEFAEKRFVEIASEPTQGRVAFMKIKSKDLRGERFLVEFFENAYQVLEDLGGDLLANRYFNLVSAFINKYSLRYELREPCSLCPTLPGIFANLMRELKTATSRDIHLNSLMKDFENAVRDLHVDCSDGRIKTCIQKQVNLIEAMGMQCPGVTVNTLGAICNQVGTWPHEKIKESMQNLYKFTCDYPGIRHGGTASSALRSIEMRDMVAMSILLVGFAPYLMDRLDADVVYRGEL